MNPQGHRGQRVATLLASVVSHINIPLYRNAYALVFSSAASSVLGLVYWLFAARIYDADVVGINAAAISAMMFLGHLSQLNMVNGLNRFIPVVGASASRFVAGVYAVTLAVAVAAALIFIVGVDLWVPALHFIRASTSWTLLFVAAVATWCILGLQDGVLTGLRRATWVPLKSILFACVKLVLLVILVTRMPEFGILVSWTIAAAIAILPTDFLIFRRLMPRHAQDNPTAREEVKPRDLAGYASLDYIGSVFTLATIGLLPVIIAELLGPEASAYYYLPWTIAYAFWMIAYGVGMSLTTEGARDRGGLQAYASRALLQGIGLVVPAVVVLLVGAPWILLLFGPQYAAESTTLLRLLCLAAVPQVVTNLYISIARIQRSMLAVILVQAIVAGIVMTLSLVLLQPLGITGIGLAWLVAQVSVAGFLVCLPLRQVTIAALGRALPSFALTIMAKAIRIHPANKDAS